MIYRRTSRSYRSDLTGDGSNDKSNPSTGCSRRYWRFSESLDGSRRCGGSKVDGHFVYEAGINGLVITDPRRVIDNLMNRWYGRSRRIRDTMYRGGKESFISACFDKLRIRLDIRVKSGRERKGMIFFLAYHLLLLFHRTGRSNRGRRLSNREFARLSILIRNGTRNISFKSIYRQVFECLEERV